MFILKRQDVDIKTMHHPQKDQQIPILSYQGQTFRLLSVFTAAQEDDARALWRDLTDNRGKACVLLEEPERFSIWGKIRLDQFEPDTSGDTGTPPAEATYIKACLLMLQVLYMDVEDLLGVKQARQFEGDIAKVFAAWKFPQATTPDAVKSILTVDPLAMPQLPPWQDHHLHRLLEETHRIGRDYFGNANFADRAFEAIEDLTSNEQALFRRWLQQSPTGKIWT
ncbi:Npun_F0813 family protein [Leptolyngbya sp. KIOST-1]|uniref:Npun_F0813 family protein n=1 Tax=Leptolyngbya sp. KIOST-1 TaxID=1229172 RepID=UPI00055F0D70|nr:Npun_F0813 family protein [Leptolyngbya sp. KIOST-1]